MLLRFGKLMQKHLALRPETIKDWIDQGKIAPLSIFRLHKAQVDNKCIGWCYTLTQGNEKFIVKGLSSLREPLYGEEKAVGLIGYLLLMEVPETDPLKLYVRSRTPNTVPQVRKAFETIDSGVIVGCQDSYIFSLCFSSKEALQRVKEQPFADYEFVE